MFHHPSGLSLTYRHPSENIKVRTTPLEYLGLVLTPTDHPGGYLNAEFVWVHPRRFSVRILAPRGKIHVIVGRGAPRRNNYNLISTPMEKRKLDSPGCTPAEILLTGVPPGEYLDPVGQGSETGCYDGPTDFGGWRLFASI